MKESIVFWLRTRKYVIDPGDAVIVNSTGIYFLPIDPKKRPNKRTHPTTYKLPIRVPPGTWQQIKPKFKEIKTKYDTIYVL